VVRGLAPFKKHL